MNIIKAVLTPYRLVSLVCQAEKTGLKLTRFKSFSTDRMAQSAYKVFVTKPIPDEAVSILKANNIDLTINDKVPIARSTLLEGVKGVDGLYCTLNEKIDREVIEIAGSQLKVIGTCSVGYDHIDYKLCKEKNIPIGFTPGVLTG